MGDDRIIGNISDTARWVAYYRAMETERPDAHFRDPFARLLAGEQGKRIVRELPGGKDNSWAVAVRTTVIDEQIQSAIANDGVDLVVNLAAGLDARPYRLAVPPSLQWIEVDLPEIVAYKEKILAAHKPLCHLERIVQDLTDLPGRRALLARLGARGRKVLVLTEGLLVYLTADDVTGIARDLHAVPTFAYWLQDFYTPDVLRFLNRRWEKIFRAGNSRFQFAPPGGLSFFEPLGWRVRAVRWTLDESRRLRREFRGAWVWRLLGGLAPPERQAQMRRMSGFAVLERV